MALAYLSAKTGQDGRICAIAYAKMEAEPRRLATMVGPERDILPEFITHHAFWSSRWRFVPVGMGLEGQLAALWDRSLAHGLADFGKSPMGRKPTVDLQHVLLMLNADAKRPENAWDDSEMPTMFFGAGLEKFARTAIPSASAAAAHGWGKAVEASLRAEFEAFCRLWDALVDEGPKWWKGTLGAKVMRSGGAAEP